MNLNFKYGRLDSKYIPKY